MNKHEGCNLTPEERAIIQRKIAELQEQKSKGETNTLSDLKAELDVTEKGISKWPTK